MFIWSDTIENRIKHLEQLGKYNEFELIEESITS